MTKYFPHWSQSPCLWGFLSHELVYRTTHLGSWFWYKSQWLKRLKTQKKLIESEIGAIFSGITSRITTKNLKIGLWGNFDLEPFLSFLAHFHLFLWYFGTPSSQYKVPLILVRDQRNLLRPFGSPKKWPTMTMEVVQTGITERRPILPFLLILLSKSKPLQKQVKMGKKWQKRL